MKLTTNFKIDDGGYIIFPKNNEAAKNYNDIIITEDLLKKLSDENYFQKVKYDTHIFYECINERYNYHKEYEII